MTTVLERLQRGVELHQQSQYDAAKKVYEDVLLEDAANADAIHLLGVLDMQAGENSAALVRLKRAVELQPNGVNILSNLGAAQRRLGLYAEALATYQRAISIDPTHAESYHNMGVALRNQKRNAEAATSFRKAIELKPGYVEAIRNLTSIEMESGNWQQAMKSSELAAKANPGDLASLMRLAECQMHMRQFASAVESFEAVLRIDPQQITALNGLGLAQKGVSKLEEAKKTLERVLELDPKNFPALANLGTVYQGLKNFDKAIECYRTALEIKADSAETHNNLGGALKEKGLMDEAFQHCLRAIEIKPNLPSAHCNLAACIQLSGKLEDSLEGYEKALKIQPDLSEGHLGIASAYAQMGRLKEARSAYSRALYFNPLNSEARLYRGIIGLLDGDLENAWSDYEWRWQMPENNIRKIAAPRWDGGELNGNAVLLHAEQGLGDTIQFVRYGKYVKARNGKLIVECQKALLPLLSRLEWIDQLVAQGEPLPPFSSHVPMLSAPGLFGTSLNSIPTEIPYLTADPELLNKWKSKVGELPGLKVGMAWQGNPDFKQDKFRSIPLSFFAPLIMQEGVTPICLQKGFGTEQIEKLDVAAKSKLTVYQDVDSTEGAFMDTAAILSQLDLFITSDSAIAHLAGALGVRTWLILPYAPDWRWLLKGETTGWYPSVKLFRQTEFNNWGPIFERIAAEINLLSQGR